MKSFGVAFLPLPRLALAMTAVWMPCSRSRRSGPSGPVTRSYAIHCACPSRGQAGASSSASAWPGSSLSLTAVRCAAAARPLAGMPGRCEDAAVFRPECPDLLVSEQARKVSADQALSNQLEEAVAHV